MILLYCKFWIYWVGLNMMIFLLYGIGFILILNVEKEEYIFFIIGLVGVIMDIFKKLVNFFSRNFSMKIIGILLLL